MTGEGFGGMSRPHNTSISRFRHGCRLPHETGGVGDGYASPGEVLTYRLSEEELARYGPVTPPEKAEQIRYWHRTLVGKKKQREEEEGMDDTRLVTCYDEEEAARAEEAVDEAGEVAQEEAQEEKRFISSVSEAAEKISREEYLRLKEMGWKDSEISDTYRIYPQVLSKLKERWGLLGYRGPKRDAPLVAAQQPAMPDIPKDGISPNQACSQFRWVGPDDVRRVNPPALTVYIKEKNVRLSTGAADVLGLREGDRVAVGISPTAIAFRKDEGGFVLRRAQGLKKGRGLCINSAGLVKLLAAEGWKRNTVYTAVFDPTTGLLVVRKPDEEGERDGRS